MKNNFNEAYKKIILEQYTKNDEEKDYEWLKTHGFETKEDESGYSVNYQKNQGNFVIVVKICGGGRVTADVRYVKSISGALLFFIPEKDAASSAKEAVSRCETFIKSLKDEIDALKEW